MEKENQLQQYFNMSDEVAQGIYSNLAVISHSSSEFILDFISMMPGVSKGTVKSRVIMSPEHSKRLLYALQENIANFERQFGEIRMPQEAPLPTMMGDA